MGFTFVTPPSEITPDGGSDFSWQTFCRWRRVFFHIVITGHTVEIVLDEREEASDERTRSMRLQYPLLYVFVSMKCTKANVFDGHIVLAIREMSELFA